VNDQDDWLTSVLMDATLGHTSVGERDLRQALLSFLEVLDSLDRLVAIAASAAEQPGAEPPGWLDQLQTLRKQLLNAFERTGVTFFDCVGQPFDPTRHEAVEVVHRRDVGDDTIVEEITRGCNWQGQLLRFARVVIARNKD